MLNRILSIALEFFRKEEECEIVDTTFVEVPAIEAGPTKRRSRKPRRNGGNVSRKDAPNVSKMVAQTEANKEFQRYCRRLAAILGNNGMKRLELLGSENAAAVRGKCDELANLCQIAIFGVQTLGSIWRVVETMKLLCDQTERLSRFVGGYYHDSKTHRGYISWIDEKLKMVRTLP